MNRLFKDHFLFIPLMIDHKRRQKKHHKSKIKFLILSEKLILLSIYISNS